MEGGLEGAVVLFRTVGEDPPSPGEKLTFENRLEGGNKTFRYLEESLSD